MGSTKDHKPAANDRKNTDTKPEESGAESTPAQDPSLKQVEKRPETDPAYVEELLKQRDA